MYDEDDLAPIRKARDKWESETHDPFVEKSGEHKDRPATVSNREVDDLYTPANMADLDYEPDLDFPSEFPYTRGVYPTMYRERTWTMRQFAGFGTAKETSERFHYLIENGQTGLSTAFDMPSLMGKDSDDPLSDNEIGKEGVAVDTLRDMEMLFDGIDIGEVTTSFIINPSASVVFAMYIMLADNHNTPREQIGGIFQSGMLKEFIAQEEWVIPPEPSLKLVTDTVGFAAEETPRIRPISVSGYHIHEAGSTAIQELTPTLADGFVYVEDMVDHGLNMDEFAPQLSFSFNSHNSIFEEVARFRATCRICRDVISEWYNTEGERSTQLKFHTQTAGQSLAAQQPLNNVVRITIQALADVLGGTQPLRTNSFDEALALPSEEAATVTLRTQQIIAEESGAADVIDPLSGDFFMEPLTDEIETEAIAHIEGIREIGDGSVHDGVLADINEGCYHREISEASYEYQSRVEDGEEIVVGVSKYDTEENTRPDLLHIEDEVQDRQLAHPESVKDGRDDEAVDAAPSEPHKTVRDGGNIMPVLVDAVKEHVMMGKIMDVFTEKCGTHRESIGVM